MGYKKSSVGLGLGLGNASGLSTHEAAYYTSKVGNAGEFLQLEHAEVIGIDLNPDKPENVGRIKFRTFNTKGQDKNSLPWAFPLNPYYRMYPVIGELVVVVEFDGRYYWLSVLNVLNTLNNNLQSNITDRNSNNNGQVDVVNYKESQVSGIPTSDSENSSPAGDTFRDKRLKIGTLLPEEGDVIVEGRFANSIRLGNNPKSNLPNIKISTRNLLDSFSIDKENIDEHSCIFLTTDEILTFAPVGIPISDVNNPPSEYNGKQILIFSDRLIFGSKLNEILMFSNKTISLASAENFSVDSGKKIITNTAENTEINTKKEFLTTSQQNTKIVSKKQFIVEADTEAKLRAAKILLGSNSADEPLILGNQWKSIMNELIDAILKITVPTGTGQSGIPINQKDFIKIKNKIEKNEQLSDDNFTTKRNS